MEKNNEFTRIGTFCERCRNVSCICKIYEFQAKQIEDTFRLVARTFEKQNFNNMQKDNLKKETLTDANNVLAVRAFIGKKVNVDIACYSFGFCYPDDNILVDVTQTEYIFKSDQIDSEDQLWRFPIKDDDCSCVVSLA
jgi:hypothetical protein